MCHDCLLPGGPRPMYNSYYPDIGELRERTITTAFTYLIFEMLTTPTKRSSVFLSKDKKDTEFRKKLAEKVGKNDKAAAALTRIKKERFSPLTAVVRSRIIFPAFWELASLVVVYVSILTTTAAIPNIDVDTHFGFHTTMRVLLLSLALLVSKVLIGYIVRGETVDILRRSRLPIKPLRRWKTSTCKLEPAFRWWKNALKNLVTRWSIRRRNLKNTRRGCQTWSLWTSGYLQGKVRPASLSTVRFWEIRNVLKHNEGVQLSITHACFSASPIGRALFPTWKKLFSRRKSSVEKTQFDLFCKNLPTPLKTVDDQGRTDFPRLMKELETAIRKFSKMMIEQEKSNAEIVCKHVLANQQKKLTIEKHIEQREEEIEWLQILNDSMDIDEIAGYIGDSDPNFQKRLEILKAIEKLSNDIAELGDPRREAVSWTKLNWNRQRARLKTWSPGRLR